MGQLSVLLRAHTRLRPGPTLSTVVQVLDGIHWDDMASVVRLLWRPADDGGSHVEYFNLGHVSQPPPAHGTPLGLHDPTVEVRQGTFDLPVRGASPVPHH